MSPTWWLYQFHPGDRPELSTDPEAWTEHDNQVGAEHYERLKQATADGKVLLAGLSLDGEGPAVVIFEAGSEDEARTFMEEDPFVAHGLFRATLHPFHPSLVRGTGES